MTIKNSMVTREQYDKLQVDLVNRIEELEQTVALVRATVETMTIKNRRLAQANNRHLEIRVVGIIAIVGFVTGLAGVLNLALN